MLLCTFKFWSTSSNFWHFYSLSSSFSTIINTLLWANVELWEKTCRCFMKFNSWITNVSERINIFLVLKLWNQNIYIICGLKCKAATTQYKCKLLTSMQSFLVSLTTDNVQLRHFQESPPFLFCWCSRPWWLDTGIPSILRALNRASCYLRYTT